MYKIKLENRKGYLLVTTLIVLVILSVLAIALLNILSSESNQSRYYEKTIQAKYLARSGANLMADYIINNLSDFEARYLDKENNFPYSIDLNGEEVLVDVEKVENGIDIISEAKYRNYTQKLSLFLAERTVNNEQPFSKPLETIDQLDTRYKRNMDLPENLSSKGSLNVLTSDTTIDLTDNNQRYNDIKVAYGQNLNINTGGKDSILIVDNIDIDGHIYLPSNGGDLYIFIRNNGTGKFKTPYKDIANRVIIFAMDNARIELDYDTLEQEESYRFIYAPFANVILKGNANRKGAIITHAGNLPPVEEKDIKRIEGLKPIGIKDYDIIDENYEHKIFYEIEKYEFISK